MKIVEPCVGMLTNLEVLRVLEERGASTESGALASEKAVHRYLAAHSAGLREERALREFMGLMQPFALTKLEVLGIMNACPTSAVEMYLLVDNCDERLGDEKVEQILNLVAMHLQH